MKDSFPLLMCGNASGDYVVKLLLIYHSGNPRVHTRNIVMKSELQIMWREKALVNRQFFTQSMHEVFAPSVTNIFRKKDCHYNASC